MNGERYGKCVNIGNCALADKRASIKVLAGQDFVCSECDKGLVAAVSSGGGNGGGGGGGGIPKNALIAGGALLMLLLVGLLGWRFIPTGGDGPIAPYSSILPPGEKPILRLGGSDTIGDKLAPALVEGYFREKLGCKDVSIEPEDDETTDVETIVSCDLNGRKIFVSVASHGTKTGFEGLGNDKYDIAMASDRIDDGQIKNLSNLGEMTDPSNEHVIALDGVAIISNPNIDVAELSLPQVAQIFSGQIKNWNEVGGPSQPITLHRRDDESGTWKFFKRKVLEAQGVEISSVAKKFESGSKLSDAVIGDPGGIGQVGLASAGRARLIPIAAVAGRPLIPNRLTIGTEDYALFRRLYLYTASKSDNKNVSDFLAYVASTAGQAIVEKKDFIQLSFDKPIPPPPLPAGAPARYAALVGNGAQLLPTTFKFNPDSFELDNRARADLARVADFLARSRTPANKLMLFGFADNQGDDLYNQGLSEKRAAAIASALAAPHGVNVVTVEGFGEALPARENLTNDGRQENRRVEIWVRN
jgi:phosphate transport system substrate-binding protein